MQTEIPWNELVYVLIMSIMLTGMYACYWWGRKDGYYEGCRARRKSERFARRLMRQPIERL